MYINNVKAEITDCIIRNNSDRGINSSNPGNSLTITNTVIRDNNELGANTNGFGAGISFNGGISHVISNCIITNNHATENGGGIFVQNIVTGTFLVTETTISGNSAIGYGGGICSNHSDLKVEKCKITFNTALSGGGGIYVNGPDRTIDLINSIVAENTSVDGSGFWFNSSSTSIVNSTFTENTTSDVVSGKGGAIYSSDGTPALINCIFWNNMAGSDAKTGHNCYAASYSTVFTFTYCDFINNNNTLSGIGTFNVDATSIGANPWFENATGGDYRLKSISPCIDFGTQTGAPADDIVGQARGVDGRGDGNVTGDLSDYDMGAYEFIR
jgi:predicted outer membrane repeat protein